MPQNVVSNIKTIIGYYLTHLKVKVVTKDFLQDLEQNPYYPSLYSLTDICAKYKIPANAYEVNKDALSELQTPYIAMVDMQELGKDLVLVTAMDDTYVKYIAKNNKTVKAEKEFFLSVYRNVVWVAEPNSESGDPEYNSKIKTRKRLYKTKVAWRITLFAITSFLIITNIPENRSISFLSIVSLKIIGILTTLVLLAYDINKENAVAKSICSAIKLSGCDAILNSNVSKIGRYSWSEIGFFYFASSALLLFMPVLSFSDGTFWLAIINASALPYVFFSIYYQWKVVKHWCPLCLIVQSVLAGECAWSIVSFWIQPSLPILRPTELLCVAVCFGLPPLIWYAIKPILAKAQSADIHEAAYKRLKNNPEIFTQQLRQQPKAVEGWENIGLSIGGKGNASMTLLKVCNPFCKPCSIAHSELEKLMTINPDLEVRIIFIGPKHFGDQSAKVSKHLLKLASEQGPKMLEKALSAWYASRSKQYDAFALNYPVFGSLETQNAKVSQMSKWCVEAGIAFTPTYFINGHRLPENYDISDLKNIL